MIPHINSPEHPRVTSTNHRVDLVNKICLRHPSSAHGTVTYFQQYERRCDRPGHDRHAAEHLNSQDVPLAGLEQSTFPWNQALFLIQKKTWKGSLYSGVVPQMLHKYCV